jgi:hypothetical protein
VLSHEPAVVVAVLAGKKRDAQLFDRGEVLHPQELLLERSDEALGTLASTTIRRWSTNECTQSHPPDPRPTLSTELDQLQAPAQPLGLRHNHPRLIKWFAGRQTELKQLHAMLQGEGTAAISGKSALAIAYSYRINVTRVEVCHLITRARRGRRKRSSVACPTGRPTLTTEDCGGDPHGSSPSNTWSHGSH